MPWLAVVLIALVALLHAWFLVLEMFLWTKPLGMKTFRMNADKAEQTKVLAANQGLYNGFLVAGLVWALVCARQDVATFFLACVVAAGAFGAATVSRRIFYVQAVPAIAALVALWLL